VWRDRLRVVITPDRLVLVRTSRWRQHVMAQRVIDLPAVGDTDAAEGRGVVQVLRQILKEAVWQHTEVRVVVSNRLVRFMLAPAVPANDKNIDKSLIISHYFKEAYGDVTAAWACRMDEAGAPLSMAMDRALVDAITQSFTLPLYQLTSIQPALAVAFNRWRRTMGTRPQWFAMIEKGHACLCLLQAGAWRQVRSITAEEDLPVEVMRTIAREQLLAGLESAPEVVSVLALDGLSVVLPVTAGCKVMQLTLPAGRGSRHEAASVALALAA
jgi:hypothetical protein